MFTWRKKGHYSKTCVKRPLLKSAKIGIKTDYSFMQIKSIAEMLQESILQDFRPALSHMPLRPLFCLLLSGRFTQVLQYLHFGLERSILKKRAVGRITFHHIISDFSETALLEFWLRMFAVGGDWLYGVLVGAFGLLCHGRGD